MECLELNFMGIFLSYRLQRKLEGCDGLNISHCIGPEKWIEY